MADTDIPLASLLRLLPQVDIGRLAQLFGAAPPQPVPGTGDATLARAYSADPTQLTASDATPDLVRAGQRYAMSANDTMDPTNVRNLAPRGGAEAGGGGKPRTYNDALNEQAQARSEKEAQRIWGDLNVLPPEALDRPPVSAPKLNLIQGGPRPPMPGPQPPKRQRSE